MTRSSIALVVATVLTGGGLVAAEPSPLSDATRLAIASALPGPSEVSAPARPRLVLLFHRTEGYVHTCIPVANHAIAEMGRVTGAYEVEPSDAMDAFSPANLARFDAILFNNTTRLAFADPAHRAALDGFVARGGGIVGIHAASDNFYTWDSACAMIGGQFDGHPWKSKGMWAVKLDEPDHPANTPFGGAGFWISDEIYQIKGPYSCDSHRVVLSLDMSKPANQAVKGIKRIDGDFPISWFKHAADGRARVFYCSLGHNDHIFWNPGVLRHYLAGIQWALGDRALPDAPSGSLATRPVPALAPTNP